MVDGYFGVGRGRSRPAARRRPRCGAATSPPGCGCAVIRPSVTWGGLVVGTGNKTEALIGYTTFFGDSACAFNPIGDLYKSQVRQLAVAMGVPTSIVRKAPSADLWPGQTDEARASSATRSSTGSCSGGSTSAARSRRWSRSASMRAMVERVDRMVAGSEFKRQVPPIAKLGPRTRRRRLPVPAAAAGVGPGG